MAVSSATAEPLDPRGKTHIPIGVANTLDTLKTFVEAEGNFSPGVGSYGVYFWLFDRSSGALTAPTMDGVKVQRGLHGQGHLIPWSRWSAGDVQVTTDVCHLQRESPGGPIHVVGARARLTNRREAPAKNSYRNNFPDSEGDSPIFPAGKSGQSPSYSRTSSKVSLYVALRPLGPAGWHVRQLEVSARGDALLVDRHAAIVASEKPQAAGVLPTDTIGREAVAGRMPDGQRATSQTGDCSGALRFDLEIPAGDYKTIGIVCPVLPGRRAVGHQWDGTSQWAQFDLAEPNPDTGGHLQPDPGLDYYRTLTADRLFAEAAVYWNDLVGRAAIHVPDPRWSEAMAAMTGHVAMSMNHGAADVAVVNYNVFNRDGVYVANILQKSGRFDLAAAAIDYFLSRPFNGRVYPEADNPGQILWIMGEHWRFTRDRRWLTRVYPSVRELAALIRYYRTTPGPHWVSMTGLRFGESLPPDERQELKPGRCDGHHPEYTEAFDVAGLRAAVLLAKAAGEQQDAAAWDQTVEDLFGRYDEQFGTRLAKAYGSYSVLWPCRLYRNGRGKALEQFQDVGVRQPTGWRYFPLATAHQGLLAGNRRAGHGTLAVHLDHPQMYGWYAFDEGGKSGSGGWPHLRTTWNHSVAMPHGWAIAELWLLLRDCLVFEDDQRLVLLAGVPQQWFTAAETVRDDSEITSAFGKGTVPFSLRENRDSPQVVLESSLRVQQLPTHFGPCSFTYTPGKATARLELTGRADPPGGFVLRLPRALNARVVADGKETPSEPNGDVRLPPKVKQVRIHIGGEFG